MFANPSTNFPPLADIIVCILLEGRRMNAFTQTKGFFWKTTHTILEDVPFLHCLPYIVISWMVCTLGLGMSCLWCSWHKKSRSLVWFGIVLATGWDFFSPLLWAHLQIGITERFLGLGKLINVGQFVRNWGAIFPLQLRLSFASCCVSLVNNPEISEKPPVTRASLVKFFFGFTIGDGSYYGRMKGYCGNTVAVAVDAAQRKCKQDRPCGNRIVFTIGFWCVDSRSAVHLQDVGIRRIRTLYIDARLVLKSTLKIKNCILYGWKFWPCFQGLCISSTIMRSIWLIF